MLSCPVQPPYLQEIRDTLERTSGSVPRSALNRTSEQTQRSFEGSLYLSSHNIFDHLNISLEQLADIPENWDSYGSPRPAASAILNAGAILAGLRSKLRLPERILPSAEGGVAFTFISEGPSRAVIESLNTGECYLLLYDLQGNARTLDWPADNPEEGLHLLDEMTAHLRGPGLAATRK